MSGCWSGRCVLRTLAEADPDRDLRRNRQVRRGRRDPDPQVRGKQATNNALLGLNGYSKINVDFKSYGVMLNFTPTVLSEGRISLAISTEVTEIDAENSFKLGQSVFRPSGRARPSRRSSCRRVARCHGRPHPADVPPDAEWATGLMNLPVLGGLFRSRDYAREGTELMMIVTPFIAKPSATAALARPDDGYTDATDLPRRC